MNEEIQAYQDVLFAGIPKFLAPYLETKAMRRLRGIGLFCGTDYTKLYRHRYFYSRMDHSVAVALIVWHFTGDKKQALAGLFHDISTPVFSHSVDFMNGDAWTQMSTEAKTAEMIRGAPEICSLLKRDGIAAEDVLDYHRYPIADNDSPRLSADRLEYTFSTALVWQGLWSVAEIGAMVHDLVIRPNESDEPELCFQSVPMAERFVHGSAAVCKAYQTNENKTALSMLGDLLKLGVDTELFTADELYEMTEDQAVSRFLNARDGRIRRAWYAFAGMERVFGSETKPKGCYGVRVNAKRRYINPLCLSGGQALRVEAISDTAKAELDELLSYEAAPYGCVDFELWR
ncbi:MAG: hypothetical protein FWF69_09305 [Firmicutes bacterium]|nr:hypothetical protein [Bacillota bacterium]